MPYREAQMCLGTKWANSYYLFFLSGTSTPANVYMNGTLTTAFPTTGRVASDSYGRFPAIYLDPSVIYRVQFFSSASAQQWQVDPYTSQLSTVGTSSLSAYGFQIAATGEFTLDAPNTGGTGVTLTLKAGVLGSAALRVTGTLAGNSAIIINSSATTGAQTATFNANNKPGTPPASTYAVTATAAPTGSYTGGNLTAAFTGTTASNYTVTLSTGQNLYNVTFTNGAVAFSVASTTITGTPTTALSVQTPVTPAGWLPITCDGVQYYTPIWHGNNFTPYAANPTAVGEVINASSVTFGGNGFTAVVGGTVTPGNWFSPATIGIGAGYYINITKTGGLSGLAFDVASNIFATAAPSGATYTGGTLTANFTGNTASNYVLLLSTGQSISGCTFTNGSTTFTCPSTNITGTPNVVLQVSTQGVWANITTGSITINSNAQATVTGTYLLSSSVSGSPIVAAGTITLSNNNGVQSQSYSGTTPIIFAGNGTVTVNGLGSSNWYSPTTSNVGSSYWINITQTGGTSGYSFSAASGAWTNITNAGLSIGISGTGASSYNVTGTYIIASDSAGVNQLGSGTISLTGGFTPVTHTYTSGSSATETVPTGASTVRIELLGSGGGGNSTGGNATFGADGGGGGLAILSSISVTGGQTLTYTVGAGAAAVFNNNIGNSGGVSSVSGSVAGGPVSMSVSGAAGGQYSGGIAYGGIGGVASGGTTNTQGNTGGTGSSGRGGNGLSGTYVTGGTGGLSNNTAGGNGGNGGNYGAGSGAATNNGTTGSSGVASGGQVAFHYT